MRKVGLSLGVLGAILLALNLPVLAQEGPTGREDVKAITPPKVVEGPKTREVKTTGMGMDEEEALRDAKRKAIEEGAGTYIYSQSKTQDFQLIKDTVLARSAGFLQSFKVLSKASAADGTVEVKISAVVSVQGIEDTWGVAQNLIQEMGRPKIMVFLTEKIDRVPQEDSTVQTRIENLLLKNGFLLVNRDQLKEIDKKDMAAAIAEDKPDKMQAIAKRFGAQLFITGSTNATLGTAREVYGVQLFQYGADGDVKCYRSDTAQLMASENANAESADRTQRVAGKKSLEALGQGLAAQVQQRILEFWMDALQGRGEVQLHVEGISFAQYAELKKALGGMKEIKAVNAKFSNNVAECSLQSELNAEPLAEKLAQAIPNLEITDVSQNVIKAKRIEK